MNRIASTLLALTLTALGPAAAAAPPLASPAAAPNAEGRTVVIKLSLVKGALMAVGRVGDGYGRGPVIIQGARCNSKAKDCGPYRKLRADKTSADGRYRISGMPLPSCREAQLLVRAAVPAKDGLPRSFSSEHAVCTYVR